MTHPQCSAGTASVRDGIAAIVNDRTMINDEGFVQNSELVADLILKNFPVLNEPQEAWMPIETAPRDEELLLGWWQKWPELRWEWASGLAGSTKGGWLHGNATHWQRLPSPPLSRPQRGD